MVTSKQANNINGFGLNVRFHSLSAIGTFSYIVIDLGRIRVELSYVNVPLEADIIGSLTIHGTEYRSGVCFGSFDDRN